MQVGGFGFGVGIALCEVEVEVAGLDVLTCNSHALSSEPSRFSK